MSLKKLTVTEINAITTFKNKNGGDSTIYEVFAVGEDGQPIEEKLRAFDLLPTNELIEVDVSPYNHEKYGMSYTLSRPGGGGGGGGGGAAPSPGARLGPKVDELRARIEALEADVAEIRSRLESGRTAAETSAGGDKEIDDIPF